MREILLLKYIDGTLTAEEHQQLEGLMQEVPDLAEELQQLQVMTTYFDASKEYQPAEAVTERFHTFLAEEMNEAKVIKLPTKRFRFKAWQIAAAVSVLLVTLSLLMLFTVQRQQSQIANLEEHIIQSNALVFELLKDKSTSGRIRAVNLSTTFQNPNQETIEVLAEILQTDPSLNVRLAALEALLKFEEVEQVRAILLQEVSKQQQPVIKIEIIHALIKLKEERALPQLQELINHPMLEQEVKDEAHFGIMQLS